MLLPVYLLVVTLLVLEDEVRRGAWSGLAQ